MPEPTYKDLIKEVYIDPIRNVVVVDDDFPPLDKLVAEKVHPRQKWNGSRENAEKVLEIVTHCRGRARPWLVDVHDASSPSNEVHVAPYLHHSDLMILDYHLEKSRSDGRKAIEILRSLAKNDHFNLVVVYTRGNAGNIDEVVREITIGLSSAKPELNLHPNRISSIENTLEVLVDAGIPYSLEADVSEQTYVNYVQMGDIPSLPEYGGFEQKLIQYSENPTKDAPNLLMYFLGKIQKKLIEEGKLSDEKLGGVETSPQGSDINWVKTDRLFLTVVNKNVRPKKLEHKLLAALVKWNPRPYQLLMSKMRVQMDDRGSWAESEIVKDDYIQAGWLGELLTAEHLDKDRAARDAVDRHWESLGDVLRMDFDDFALRLHTVFSPGGHHVFKKFSLSEARKDEIKVQKHLNRYNSTKTIDSSHLSTGHVLAIMKPNTICEYWVCLSPACDLVPEQKDNGWFGRLKNLKPFMAVRLFPIDDKTAIKNVQRNIFLFLDTDSKGVCSFTFHNFGKVDNNPQWELMYAQNQGRMGGGELKIVRISGAAAENALNANDEYKVKVVAQLRYEYALNLLQRLGGTLTRIGLDFNNRAI